MFGSDQDDDLRDRIVVFTTLGCPHSAQLKKFLKSKNVVFNEVQISNYPVGFMAVDKMLKRGSPALSLPRVFSNGVYIGVRLFIAPFLVLTRRASLTVTKPVCSRNCRTPRR